MTGVAAWLARDAVLRCKRGPAVLGLAAMVAHSVKMLVEHPLNVGNLGVEFEVRKGGKLLGKLQISQTSIDWTPAKARNPRKAGWQEFGDWMEGKGGGARRNGPAPAAVVVAEARADTVTDDDSPEESDSADSGQTEAVEAGVLSEASGLREVNAPDEVGDANGPSNPWAGRY